MVKANLLDLQNIVKFPNVFSDLVDPCNKISYFSIQQMEVSSTTNHKVYTIRRVNVISQFKADIYQILVVFVFANVSISLQKLAALNRRNNLIILKGYIPKYFNRYRIFL